MLARAPELRAPQRPLVAGTDPVGAVIVGKRQSVRSRIEQQMRAERAVRLVVRKVNRVETCLRRDRCWHPSKSKAASAGMPDRQTALALFVLVLAASRSHCSSLRRGLVRPASSSSCQLRSERRSACGSAGAGPESIDGGGSTIGIGCETVVSRE